MKIVIDMNLSPDWVGVLAKHGFIAVHWSMVGDPRAEDSVLNGLGTRKRSRRFNARSRFWDGLGVNESSRPILSLNSQVWRM